MSRPDVRGLPVDPAPDEWPLLPESGDGATAAAAGSRLARLEQTPPRFPPLPPSSNEWSYGASSLAQRKKREAVSAAGTAGRAQAGAPVESMRDDKYERKHADDESDASDADDAMDARSVASAASLDSGANPSSVASAPIRRMVPTADLLYDENADMADEAWVATSSHRFRTPAVDAGGAAAASPSRARGPRTDAHLSCPACFSPLTVDCQQHATRPTQFRAMFVLDAAMVDRQRLVKPNGVGNPNEKFYAVLCRVCKTHVGVLDEDDVYHFYHVVAGQS